ncbi:unnamed protein product [Didymodactylos carnosus]|uniref:Uncharacterized protein n=1 Tax=Didymodactylos carnosus TaxID=1234261 RepID=A0A8S2I281_9BILA|nr:unnamed protein product [Didymodactylos carnosus]CAF3707448.1 unnamed protein product [Didymodactylos carnosus]
MSLYSSSNSPKWTNSSSSNDYNNSHHRNSGNKYTAFNDRPNISKRIRTDETYPYRRGNFSSPPQPLYPSLDDEPQSLKPRPSLSERLGLKNDDSDENEDESTPYSPSHTITKTSIALPMPPSTASSSIHSKQQGPTHLTLDERIIRNPQLSLLESTLSASSVDRKSIMDLLGDHTSEDEEEEIADDENQPYSPSQLDSTTMEQVSHQLRTKPMSLQQPPQQHVYVPPPTKSTVVPTISTSNTTTINGTMHQSELNNDIDYRKPTTSNSYARHHRHGHVHHKHHRNHHKKNDETHENPNNQNQSLSTSSTDLIPSSQHHHQKQQQQQNQQQLSKKTSSTVQQQIPLTFHGLSMLSSTSDEPRSIPIHGEAPVVDPRIKIYSNRLKSKVRQLCLERLEQSKSTIEKVQLNNELDTLVECHGKRLYWYRVICFLQNIQTQPKTSSSYIKELNKLLILTPTLSKLLKVKQRYPKKIPIDEISSVVDPRIGNQFYLKSQKIIMKSLQYTLIDNNTETSNGEDIESQSQAQLQIHDGDNSDNDPNENDFDREEMDIEEEEDQNDEE